jgi:hypothetical protein
VGIEFGGGSPEVPRWYVPRERPEITQPPAERGFVVLPPRPRERPEVVLGPAESIEPTEVVRSPTEPSERSETVEPTTSAFEVEAARRDHRIEAAHAERIAEARGEKGFIDQVKDFVHNVVTQVIERAAFVAANHIAPGIGGYVVNLAVKFKNAIDNIENLSRNGTIELQIPVVTGADGMFGLWVGPTISENEKRQTTFGIGADPAVGIYEHLEVGKPDIEVTAPDDDGASNESTSVILEIKVAEYSESTTSEMKLRRHEAISQQEESVTRRDDPNFGDYSQPPSRQRVIELPEISLEWIRSGEKEDASRPVEATEHEVDDNAHRVQSRETRAPSLSEIPQAATRGHEARSLADSSLRFTTGNQTHTRGSSTNGSSGGFTAGTAAGTTGSSTSGGRATAGKVTGVVVWGSAAAIAAWANSPILSARILLQYIKRRIFDEIYDGSAISVARQRKAVRNLEVIIFLDTTTGVGLWVDVDPATQEPAATLFINIDRKNALKPVRFFRYEP